jgi:hypothetical protein
MDSTTIVGRVLVTERERTRAAIDVLKAAIACDTYPMIVIENRFGRGAKDRSLDAVRKGLAELALDILCGEQPC